MMGYDMMGSWSWLVSLLAMALVVGVTWLIHQPGSEGGRRHTERSAIAELELRCARVEADRENYVAIRRDLEADNV